MFPKVNQMLFYNIASSDKEEAAEQYKSRIADEEDGMLLIEYPINEKTGKFKRLFLGDELSVYFVNNEGVKHYFDSHVLGFVEDKVRLIKIIKPDPDKMTKIQRRNFLRVSAELEIAVKLANQERHVFITYDVGGGGISFMSDKKSNMEAGQQLESWLLLQYKNGSIEHVSFTAEVVRINFLETGRMQVMCKFIAISDSDRQKIIRYCFERQLEFRNR